MFQFTPSLQQVSFYSAGMFVYVLWLDIVKITIISWNRFEEGDDDVYESGIPFQVLELDVKIIVVFTSGRRV